MQNRYTGDIGDFAKFGLLRYLCEGQSLGVAWYLYPDEEHNKDGRHIKYLDKADKWRHLDPDLFDGLREFVYSGSRDVKKIEDSGLLGNAVFSRKMLSFDGDADSRKQQRLEWFQDVLYDLDGTTLIFADPDNGLCEDRDYVFSNKSHWKRMPLSEAHILTMDRTSILYHHNSRRQGGHIKEIQHWMSLLGPETIGLYWRRISNRTFFIVNPSDEIKHRAHEFVQKWAPHFELISSTSKCPDERPSVSKIKSRDNRLGIKPKLCPECGHAFKGAGWGGIDAHWKAQHGHIMSYEDAWPLIKTGNKPSLHQSEK